MDTYLFDDRDSVWHAVLGFLISLLMPGLIIALVTLIFLVYEVREPENPISTVGDVVEFLSGAYIGLGIRVAGLV